MNTVENCSLDYISQMHTCCQWQMVCCRAMSWVFEDYRVFCWCDECRCSVLSSPCQPSVSSFASCLLLFSSKTQVFIMTVNRAGERGRERTEKWKVPRFVFHIAHMVVAALLAYVWVKKFPELKWSMPQSHDIHLTPPLPPLSPLPSSPQGQSGVITVHALLGFFWISIIAPMNLLP